MSSTPQTPSTSASTSPVASSPPSTALTSENHSVIARVKKVLSLIRPAIQSDGGDIEFIGITPDHKVQIRLHGACVGCPSSLITLRTGIERNVRNHVPEITGVEAVE